VSDGRAARPWTRYWSPRSEPPALDDAGFLVDPAEPYGREWNPAVATLDALAARPLLVLLGEPGMGKTTELRRLGRRLAAAAAPDETVLRVDLRDYESFADLRTAVFAGGAFAAWQSGARRLVLLLDSLDEALLASIPLADRLAGELARLAADPDLRARLRVRIACRTAVWPESAEAKLRDAWGAEYARPWVLAPLRRADVLSTLRERGVVDPDAAFRAILDRDAGALAARPVTLEFLAGAYAADAVPATQAALYEQGCLRLADEPNLGRARRRPAATLAPRDRLAVASRAAALIVLGNRAGVRLGPLDGPVPGGPRHVDLEAADVCDGAEPVRPLDGPAGSEARVAVTRAAVVETLETALFHASPAGRAAEPDEATAGDDADDAFGASDAATRFTFAHWSFAEFLAARWAHVNGLTPAQLDRLFFVRVDGAPRVVPQLRQPAAWLAGVDAAFLRRVLRDDPTVLLRSDIAVADPDDRARLVDALLALARADALDYDVYGLSAEFRALAHRGLAEELLPVVADGAEPTPARILALRIATAARVDGLAPVALAVALDAAHGPRLRQDAVRAVRAVGSAAEVRRLRALLLPGPAAGEPSGAGAGHDPDPDDQVKGEALAALWPDHLSAAECFGALTPPKRDNLLGSYKWFIIQLAKQVASDALDEAGLRTALEWLGPDPADDAGRDPRRRYGVLADLANAVLRCAWRRLAAPADRLPPGVADGLATVVARRVALHEPLADKEAAADLEAALADPVRRRTFGEALLRRLAGAPRETGQGETDYHGTAVVQLRLVRGEDVPWLLETWRAAEARGDAALAAALVDVLAPLAWWGGEEALDAVYRAAYGEAPRAIVDLPGPRPPLARALDDWLGPVPTSGAAADRARRAQERQARYDAQDEADRARVAEALDAARRGAREQAEAAAAGDLEAWWRLHYYLSASETGHREEWDPRLVGRPLWAALDAEVRNRLRAVARRYLEELADERESWVAADEPQRYRRAMAGFRALRFLQECDPAAFDALGTSVWRRWAGVVVAYPLVGDAPDAAWYADLRARAYAAAPEDVADWIVRVAAAEDARHGAPILLDRLGPLWDVAGSGGGALGAALFGLARASATPPAPGLGVRGLAAVLGALLAHAVPGARAYAEETLGAYAASRSPASDEAAAPTGHPPDDVTAPASPTSGPRANATPAREAGDREAATRPVRADSAPPAARDPRARALAAAEALLARTPDAGWAAVWPLVAADRRFAEELLTAMGSRRGPSEGSLAARLDAAQVAALHRRLAELFPPEDDRDDEDGGTVGPREEIARWRDALLRDLVERGTPEALAEVRALREALPGRRDLAHATRLAESALRRAAWTPPAPSELLVLARGGDRRIVATERDLADAVAASLARFAQGLRGVNANVAQFWDRDPGGRWRPKDEETLANALAVHLERDLGPGGVTTAREVRVRPAVGPAPAEDVDLQVEARVADAGGRFRTVRAMVEVKGQWNRGLKDAIRTQLVERYLARNAETATGLYVVGWYLCAEWDPDDYRRDAAARNGTSRDALAAALEGGAARLSTPGRDVRAVVLDLALSDVVDPPPTAGDGTARRPGGRARAGRPRGADPDAESDPTPG
jgi:hypothetical protein